MTIDYDLLKKVNTIYIISKGRPQCTTAKTLTKMKYPGEWFIVCGNNDETVSEYKKRWGDDRVLIFDWYEEIKTTETMDNFGFEKMPSGAVPVRNATRKISEERGELRHWQFDDDYKSFAIYDKTTGKNRTIRDGDEFYEATGKIATFAYKANLKNCGFTLTSSMFPNKRYNYQRRVFNAHNMPSDAEKFQTWRGRLNDDTINALDIIRKGGRCFSFNFLGLKTKPTQQESGGLTEFYKEVGTVRKTAYAILANPKNARMVAKFGRYHHDVKWSKIQVKTIDEKWKKVKVGVE